MARHGDGLYLRGQTWFLDCRINGVRLTCRFSRCGEKWWKLVPV
jgi:hypothetical protein